MSGTGGDGGERSVDDVAALLREDPVVVDTVLGNGHTAEVDAALTDLAAGVAEQTGLPVHVALVDAPADLAGERPGQDLLLRLHERLGEDGLYVVAPGPDRGIAFRVFGDEAAQDAGRALTSAYYEITLGTSEQLDAGEFVDWPVSDTGDAALVLTLAAGDPPTLTGARREELLTEARWAEPPVYEPVDESDPPGGAIAFFAVGAAAAVFWLGLGAARRHPVAAARARTPRSRATTRRHRPVPPDPALVRSQADEELTALAEELAARPARGRRARGDLTTALGCRVAAEHHLDSADPLDVVGSLVLARAGRHALSGRDPGPYRPCFIDPLHGAAAASRDLLVAGREPVRVPCCRACARADESDLEPLVVGRRRRPYWRDDSVWARTGFGALDDGLWQAASPGADR